MSETQGWGEYIIHYDDDSYQHRIPSWIDLDGMTAEFPDGDVGEHWEPSEPPSSIDWDESWEEVEFGDETYPAVQSQDEDGWEHMVSTYGEGNFVEVRIPED